MGQRVIHQSNADNHLVAIKTLIADNPNTSKSFNSNKTVTLTTMPPTLILIRHAQALHNATSDWV